MKFTFPLSLLALFFMISCASGPNDLDRSGIKGRLKSYKEMQWIPTTENGKWVAGDPSRFAGKIVNYDREGLVVESYTLTSQGDTLGISTFTREEGEMVEESYLSLYDRITTRTILDRMADDQVNFEVWRDNQLYYEGANYFDKKGRVIRQVQVSNGREINVYSVFEKELLVEHYQVEVTGEQTAWQQYEYDGFDKKGNWTVKLVYVGQEKIKPEIVVTRELQYWD